MLVSYSSRIFFKVSFYSWKSVQYFTTNELVILAWMLLQKLLASGGLSLMSFRTELRRHESFREMGSAISWPWRYEEIGPSSEHIPRVHCQTLQPWCGSLNMCVPALCWRALYLLELEVLPDFILEEYTKIQLGMYFFNFLRKKEC